MNPLHIWIEALSSWIDDVLGTLLWNLSTAGSNKKLGGKFVIASCCPHIFLVRKLIPLWFSKSGGASRPAFAKPRPPSLSWRKAQLFPSLHQPWVWKVHILAAHLVSFSRCSPGDEIFNLCYEMNKVRYKPGRFKYATEKKTICCSPSNTIIKRLFNGWNSYLLQRTGLLITYLRAIKSGVPKPSAPRRYRPPILEAPSEFMCRRLLLPALLKLLSTLWGWSIGFFSAVVTP